MLPAKALYPAGALPWAPSPEQKKIHHEPDNVGE
jgi:hypothetical protein